MTGSNVISLSGGKDSTAMLLLMLERGEPVCDVIFFDTGWEFPQMLEHIDRLERYTGIPVVRLKPRRPFDYLFAQHRPVSRKDVERDRGYGWPCTYRRWCNTLKVDALNAYSNALSWRGYPLPIVQCIGYAADETKRVEKHRARPRHEYIAHRYPLAEWNVTEAEALALCKRHGFDWGGLYDHFTRVSCFCCPLSNLTELRIMRKHYPTQWARILQMDTWLDPNHHRRAFYHGATINDLDRRFAREDAEGAA